MRAMQMEGNDMKSEPTMIIKAEQDKWASESLTLYYRITYILNAYKGQKLPDGITVDKIYEDLNKLLNQARAHNIAEIVRQNIELLVATTKQIDILQDEGKLHGHSYE